MSTRLLIPAVLLAATASGYGSQTPQAGVDPRPPNAAGQAPAFAEQTRAPERKTNVLFEVVTVAQGLDKPWSLAFLPSGKMLVTERPGRLRVVTADGTLSPPVTGLPAMDTRDQGGLFDVVLDPRFATSQLIYWSYAEPRDGGLTNTAVARGKFVDGAAPRVEDVQVIYHQAPSMSSTKHYGSRLVFGRDGTLFVTQGDRAIPAGRTQAQQMDGLLGKIARINADGTIPKDNPFVGKDGVRPEIWSSGHRNMISAALNPTTGELWTVDHGVKGGDEINVARKGKDYGWPSIFYGIDDQPPATAGTTAKDGLEQPIYYWDPVVAPSGMLFYTGDLFPPWKGSLFVGGLATTTLARLEFKGDRIVGEERLLTDLQPKAERIRDVRQGPDGAIYVLTDNVAGRILKLLPKAGPQSGVEPRAPNATGQTPAFPGQTRAPEAKTDVPFDVVSVAEGLDKPWGLAFLPSGKMLVTEKAGRLRVVNPDGTLSPPVTGLPAIDLRGQGGLHDVALDPSFASNKLIYWSYAEPREGGLTNTAVARGAFVDGAAPRVDDVQVIYHQAPSMNSTLHYGSRLVWNRDGTLFVTQGERSIVPGRMQAQQMDGLLGKIVRINADGTIPKDNPFVGKEGVRPEIWSLGHRNIQSATLNPATGELWEVEHGTRGGDEINIARKGKDYGWPTIAYGIEYQGGPINGGITAKEGMEQPVYYWDPVIAPSGMLFYTGDLFPAWKGSLFIGGLNTKNLVRLDVKGDRVVGEERLLREFQPAAERIRDVRQGPDGSIYLLTDNVKGRILRLVPKK